MRLSSCSSALSLYLLDRIDYVSGLKLITKRGYHAPWPRIFDETDHLRECIGKKDHL
jgi:hypothetical protein